jgi:hypothetical protein
MDEKTARTKLDILYYDVLGEINETITRVEAIKAILPEQAENIEKQLTGMIGLLERAGDRYGDTINKYATAATNEMTTKIESEERRALAELQRQSSAILQQILRDCENTVKTTMRNEIMGPVQRELRAQHQSIWHLIGLCAFAATLSGLIVLLGSAYYNSSFTALGHATAAAWNKLDAKTKAAIEAERQ